MNLWMKEDNALILRIQIFVDEQFTRLFQLERWLQSIGWFCITWPIIISVLGLFGLLLYTAERRTKEIGYGKFGCNGRLAGLLSKDFFATGFYFFFLSPSNAWWIWITGFRIYTGFRLAGEFPIAGTVANSHRLITVSFQTIKRPCESGEEFANGVRK